ncbi:MAG: ATP-binding protein, partial [Geminicoccaceae bacterium]
MRNFIVCGFIIVVACGVSLFAFVESYSTSEGPSIHHQNQADLRELEKLYTQLSQDVLRSRNHLLTHFDTLAQVILEIRVIDQRLNENLHRARESYPLAAQFLTLAGPELAQIDRDYAASWQKYKEIARQNFDAVEYFKRANAVNRNSLAYFQDLTTLPASGSGSALEKMESKRLSQEMAVDIVLYNQLGLPSLRERIEKKINASAFLTQTLSGKTDHLIVNVLRHARIIIDSYDSMKGPLTNLTKNEVQGLLKGLAELQLRQRILMTEGLRRYQDLSTWLTLIAFAVISIVVIRNLLASRRMAEAASHEKDALLQTLEHKVVEARQADRAKSEFLATMSHEIRTPMNGIIGMTELLLESELNHRQHDNAQTVLNSADSLLGLINDILDFSKIDSGNLELESVPVDLVTLTEDLAELIAVRASEKALDVAVRYVPGTPQFFIGDPVRLRQLLLNLMGNAIKFTEKGYVLITVEAVEDADIPGDKVMLRVSIEDTGIGVPEDKREAIFERFSQADSSTTRKFGGTGLGLSICKQLVEMMEGEIAAEGNRHGGSTFWFTACLDVNMDANEVKPDYAMLSGIRAIIVDDIEVNRRLVSEQLASVGVSTVSCDGARHGLRLIREAALSGQPFDLALIDYQMPEQDGESLIREIKADPAICDVEAIVLTSVGESGYATQLRKAGAAGLLTKP